MASLSAISLTISVAGLLDVVGVECQSIVATTVVLTIVLPVLAIVLTIVLPVVLTILTLAVLTVLAILSILTVLAVVLPIVLTELGVGNTGCEQQWQQSSVTHDDGRKLKAKEN